jgi:hypothetical protein
LAVDGQSCSFETAVTRRSWSRYRPVDCECIPFCSHGPGSQRHQGTRLYASDRSLSTCGVGT